MDRKLRVALVGGGLGGLTAALALNQRGFEVEVFEQASKLRELGAGIGISPNPLKVLRALGLEEEVKRYGTVVEAITMRDWTTGQELFRQAESLPPRHLPADTTFWVGPGGHIATYYIRHGALVNVVAVRETTTWLEESWSVEGNVEELVAAFPNVHEKLRILLEQAKHCFKWGLFDRDPLPIWSKQRVTLLGDAAHPMLPFLGQGVAMAIEDAYVLARELARSPQDVAMALRAYEAERLPRTSQVQLASRERGRILHMNSQWDPITSAALNIDWVYHYDPTSPADPMSRPI